jgi:predicted nucleic acid-binding protein
LTHFVLDASIVLTWCFPDEEALKAERISERIAQGDKPAVPAFWRHEVLNALMMGEKRKRLTPELIQSFIRDLEQLPTEVDTPGAGTVFHTTQDLCRKHGLTAYDAAYLGRFVTALRSLLRTQLWSGQRAPRESRLCSRIVSTAPGFAS